jgi:hypothetical protein
MVGKLKRPEIAGNFDRPAGSVRPMSQRWASLIRQLGRVQAAKTAVGRPREARLRAGRTATDRWPFAFLENRSATLPDPNFLAAGWRRDRMRASLPAIAVTEVPAPPLWPFFFAFD